MRKARNAVTKSKLQTKVAVRYQPRVRGASTSRVRVKETDFPLTGFGIDNDDANYRPIGGRNQQDLNVFEHQRALAISEWLYARDPLAGRMVDVPINAIQNGGVKVYSKNPAKNEILKEWWLEMQPLLFGVENQGLLHLSRIYGELSIPFETLQYGFVDYGYLNPKNIEKITKKPGNALVFDKIFLRSNPNSEEKNVWQIVRKIGGTWIGDAFHWGLFMPLNASRGRPFLFRFMDYLEVYGQFLMNEAERANVLKSFLWMVTLSGKSPEECVTWLQQNFPEGIVPKPGTVRAKTEGESWEVMNPDLKSSDASGMAEMLKLNAFGGTGYPIYFLGYGGNINNQVSREMMTVANWEFARVQSFIKTVIVLMATHRIDMAAKNGQWTSQGQIKPSMLGEDDEVLVEFGSPIPRDEVQGAAALSSIVNAATGAISQGIMSKMLGKQLVLTGAKMLGVEKDADDLDKEIKQDQTEAAESKDNGVLDLYKRNPFPQSPNGNGVATAHDGERPNYNELDGEAA